MPAASQQTFDNSNDSFSLLNLSSSEDDNKINSEIKQEQILTPKLVYHGKKKTLSAKYA